MKILSIPFVKHTGIIRNEEGKLVLPFTPSLLNHLETLHASAQFTLAETASGECLQITFPDLVDQVVPVLRESRVKFRKPATQPVSATANIEDRSRDKFLEQIHTRKRALISVHVTLSDSEGNETCSGEFHWFIQMLNK